MAYDPEVQELVMYANNDYQLHMKRRRDFMKNALKKMNAGTYELSKAVKLWRYYADEVAKKYTREFGGSFSPAVRNKAAAEFARQFETEVRAGEHEDLRRSVMTKAQKKAAESRASRGGRSAGPAKKTVVIY